MFSDEIDSIQVEQPSETKGAWRRKSWKEMSPVQRGTNIVLAVVQFVLTGWALWDIGHRPADQINGKKPTWVMASFIQPIGPVIYFIFGRKRSKMQMTG